MDTRYPEKKNRGGIAAFIPYFIIVVIAFLLAIRSFYCLDLTDEPYFIALVDWIYRGRVPFVDIWAKHVTSAMLLVPFASAWNAIVGSNDGIIVAYRMLLVCIQALIASIAFRMLHLQMRRSKWASLIVCVAFLVTAPLAIPCPNYNALQLCFGELLIVMIISYSGGEIKAFAIGFVAFLLIQVYPQMVICSLLAIALWCYAGWGKTIASKQVIWCILGFVAGGLVLIIENAILGASPLLVMSNISNVLLSSPSATSAQMAGFLGLARNILKYSTIWGCLLMIAALIISILCRCFPKRASVRFLLVAVLVAFFVLWCVNCYMNLDSRPRIVYLPGYVLFGVGFVSLCLTLAFSHIDLRVITLLLFGLTSFFVVQLTTDQGLQISGYQFLFVLIALLFNPDEQTHVARHAAPSKVKPFSSVWITATSIVLVVSLSTLAGSRILGHYRDSKLFEMNERIDEGAAAWIMTTEKRCSMYESIYRFLKSNEQGLNSIAVEVYYPIAYLDSSLAPMGYTPGRVSISSEKLDLWYELHGNVAPDAIMVFNDRANQYQWFSATDTGGFLGGQIGSLEYECTTMQYGKLYTKHISKDAERAF